MRKIKLNERQVLMLQKLPEDESKTKVMKINEDQYSRLFRGGFKANEKLSKNIDKAGLNEKAQKIDLLGFAQELIVFIKDMISRPDEALFSDYWLKLGIDKDMLVDMLEKEGLLTSTLGEVEGTTSYIAEKYGFRRKVKEFFTKVMENSNIPAGADTSDAPWNQAPRYSKPRNPKERPFEMLWHSPNNAAIFSDVEGKKYVFHYEGIDRDEFESYVEREETDRYKVDGDYYVEYSDEWEIDDYAVDAFVNDNANGLSMGVGLDAWQSDKEMVLIDDELAGALVDYFKDETLAKLLGVMGETTGAASSGAYVAGASFGTPIKKDTGNSPEQEMDKLIKETDIDSSYTHFAVLKDTGEIVNGWDYTGVDTEDIKTFSREDLKADFPENKPSEFKIVTIRGFLKQGVDPFDANNWRKVSELGESTTTTSVGGVSGTFAYDAPVGTGGDFWTAGNKQNKKMGKGGAVARGKTMYEGYKTGTVFKNGILRRKIVGIKKHPITQAQKGLVVKQWGDGSNKEFTVEPKDMDEWDFLTERKVIRVTQEQFDKIVESENLKKTAYPNGAFVDFDDCTKLNNNKVAQNGGCSQGDDGVVKQRKTKGSVVAEDFNPQIAGGSVYAIEVSLAKNGSLVVLRQDNGQEVVAHWDDIPELINVLNSIQ